MRVLQLIDSLRPGGAERMAVNYANALSKRIEASYLCCTRMEGLLRKQVKPEVGYLFLGKKSTLDIGAFIRLRRFVKENKISIIQAHSSSFFLATLVKLSLPKVRLIWHDHFGRELSERNPGLLTFASRYFDGIIAVNEPLKIWSEKHLKGGQVRFFKNFISEGTATYNAAALRGAGFNILCLANLRPQKDHWNLLKAFKLVLEQEPAVSLHLVGKEEDQEYARALKEYVQQNGLEEKVFFYGEQEEVRGLLQQAQVGVLSSVSEGLPLALLEYGQAGLPVVCTAVGECPKVVGAAGKLVPAKNPEALAMALLEYSNHQDRRKLDAETFQQQVLNNFPESAMMGEVVQWLKSLARET